MTIFATNIQKIMRKFKENIYIYILFGIVA